jgi:hypothetical protein
MDEMIESLTSSDTIVHTVDVNGLESDLEAHFERRPYKSGQDSLIKIAHHTGGVIIKDTNDPARELSNILDMSRKYYVLAFEPIEFKEPGRFHDLEVRVHTKGTNVSHRRGYWEPHPEFERDARIQQLSAVEIISKRLTGGPIELRALAVPYRDEESRVTVSVMLEVDGKTLLDRSSGENLSLEIYGYMFNESGAVVDFVSIAPRVSLKTLEATIREKGFQLYTSFRGVPGRYDLRFLVRDTETGRSGAMATEIDVPSFEPGQIVLYPPLFMDDPGQGVILRERSGFEPHLAIPYRVAREAFTPPGRPQLDMGRTHRVCVMFSDGGTHYESGAKFEVKPQLLSSDGVPVRLSSLRLEKAIMEPDSFRRFVLSFKVDDIPIGDYTFVVKLVDPSTEHITTSQQKVLVN